MSKLYATQVGADGKTRILYAIAIERKAVDERDNAVWKPAGFVYLHALDWANAHMEYRKTDVTMQTRIVACAPCIGFNVTDRHGERLSA
jgi:hypothetical protein